MEFQILLIQQCFFHDTDNDGLSDFVDPDDGGVPSLLPDGDGDGEYDFRIHGQ